MEIFYFTSAIEQLRFPFVDKIEPSYIWMLLAVGGLMYAVVYTFRAIGLYTIANREGYKSKWMAFVPVLSTYYIGVCGQKNKFFNIKTRTIAIVAAITEVVIIGLFILYYVSFYNVAPYLKVRDFQEILWRNGSIIYNEWGLTDNFEFNYPELAWAGWCYRYLMSYVIDILELFYLLAMIVTLNCFFQTYSPRRYFIFTLFSILFPSVQGIFIFAVRNNKGVRYADYVRIMQEKMYRQYRSQQNFNQNPYNQNPYSGGYNNYSGQQAQQQPQNSAEPEAPFSEFGTSSGGSDPFDEFKN